MTLEEDRQKLSELTRESFLLTSDIGKAEEDFQERYHVLKKKANKLYCEMDDRLNGE